MPMNAIAPTPPPARHGPRPLVVLAVLLTVLGAGMLAFGRLVDDFTVSIALQVLWFALVAIAGILYARRTPGLLRPVAGTLAACAVLGGFGFYWTTARDVEVNERVVTGVKASALPSPAAKPTAKPVARPAVDVELAAGSFASLAHETTGTAAIVDLADGGRRLTLTDLNTDNGPDLRLYLVPGAANADGSVDGGVDLGRLKGNIGTQQYEVPAGVRVADGASVVVWCRAFTVAFGVAQLERS
jgi:hypothetical protein